MSLTPHLWNGPVMVGMSERKCMMELENMVGEEQEGEISLEEQRRLLEERQAELDKREKDLNKGFMEVAARERELSERPVYMEEPEDDDVPPLAPEAEKVLDKYFERKYGHVIKAQQEMYADTVNSELESISQRTGVAPEDILSVINETGLYPRDDSIKSARETLSAAAEIYKARTFNRDELEKSVREQVLKELAESGATIEAVKPTRELPDEAVDVDSMTPQQRYEFYKRKS